MRPTGRLDHVEQGGAVAAVPRLEVETLLALTALLVVVHMLVATRYGWFRDELYYFDCGRHLAWGYVDHPPMVALLARVCLTTFGPSLAGLRFFAILAGAATGWLTGLIARELGGGRFGQGVAVLVVSTAPVFLLDFHIFTVNALEAVFWSLAAWLVLRILHGAHHSTWLLLGFVVGAGLMAKHSMLFLTVSLAIGFALTEARSRLASPWPWLGAGLAAACCVPNLLWEIRNGWPTIEFFHNDHMAWRTSPVVFLLVVLVMLSPLAAPLWISGLASLFGRENPRNRPIAWSFVILLLAFATRVPPSKAYYLAPAFPALLAAGSVAFEKKMRHRIVLRTAVVGLLLLSSVVLSPLVLPVLSPRQLIACLETIRLETTTGAGASGGRLPQTFADMFGWPEMEARVARAYRKLAPGERSQCLIYAHNFGEAGALDLFGARDSLPPVLSGHNSYWYWGGEALRGVAKRRGNVVITVGETREDVLKTYADVVEVDRTDAPLNWHEEDRVPIFVGRRPRVALADVWPRCRRF